MNPMVVKILSRCVLLLLLTGLLLPTAPGIALAADNGYAYHWRLQFDFENSITGQLFVEVGYNDNGAVKAPALYSRSFPVTCQRVGNMTVSGGVAKFNGGYLQCTLEVKRAIEQTFVECDALYPGCTMAIGEIETYRSIKTRADLASPPGVVAPLFAHPSASYAVTVATVQAQMQSTLNAIGVVPSAMTTLSAPTTTLQAYSSRWLCFATGDCRLYYNISGQATELVDTLDVALPFVTTPTTFYIGRDLAGSIIAPGSAIDNLLIDPGNGLPTG